MQARLVVLLAWLTLALPLDVQADGKVFSQVTAVKTVTPDQRALLHYANGTETLVVETTFVGAGTNFAWVVPLPAAPEITAVPRTVFTNLEMLFRPEIIHKQPEWWRGMVFVVFLAWLAHFLSKRFRIGLTVVEVMVIIAIVGLLAAILIPNYVKARGLTGTQEVIGGVTVLAREQVGVFDIVTIKSPDGLALVEWLKENSFALPAAATPVISSYAAQGWVFATAKFKRADETGKTSPHPLAFKFKTDRAVYPLRLTGVENARCIVELFVFGDARAELPGFVVENCLLTVMPATPKLDTDFGKDTVTTVFQEPPPGVLRVRHPVLRSLIAKATVGTKLVGTLDSETMGRDAFLDWQRFKEKRPVFYSIEAATLYAVNVAAAIATGGLLLHLAWLRRMGQKWLFLWMIVIYACALAVGVATYQHLEKREVTVKIDPRYNPYNRANTGHLLHTGIQQWLKDHKPDDQLALPPGRWTLASLKNALQPFYKGDWYFMNAFTGKLLREEATPGNLLFRPTERGTEVIWHDVDCVEHLLGTLPVRAP